MSTVISVLAALIVLSIFVVLHELGHYCAGRIFGFGIVEFSVGMGPAIIKKEKNGGYGRREGVQLPPDMAKDDSDCRGAGDEHTDDYNTCHRNAYDIRRIYARGE